MTEITRRAKFAFVQMIVYARDSAIIVWFLVQGRFFDW